MRIGPWNQKGDRQPLTHACVAMSHQGETGQMSSAEQMEESCSKAFVFRQLRDYKDKPILSSGPMTKSGRNYG